jgi:hypothetical protein
VQLLTPPLSDWTKNKGWKEGLGMVVVWEFEQRGGGGGGGCGGVWWLNEIESPASGVSEQQ